MYIVNDAFSNIFYDQSMSNFNIMNLYSNCLLIRFLLSTVLYINNVLWWNVY